MSHILSQSEIISEAKHFANHEIRPYAAEFDNKAKLPRELITKLAKKGYLAASLPHEYGGLSLDPIHFGLFIEQMGKACCSIHTLITVNNSLVGETILRWGTGQQKNKWLPSLAKGEKLSAFALTEPKVGSNAKGVQAEYTKIGANYIINGAKKWISFGALADFFIVIARSGQAITAFIVERGFEGVISKPIQGMLAGRATYLAEIRLNNVQVPEENVLGPEGGGFSFIVNTALDHGRYSVAWAGVAIAQEALEAMISYARKRRQFDRPIYNFQLIQGMIGDTVTNVHTARALCLHAGGLRKEKHPDAIAETCIAKYFTSKVANNVAGDALQIHGANGCCQEYPVERLFREAKLLEIIEGTSQIQQEIIANYGIKKYKT